MAAVEIKSGATVASDWFDPLDRVANMLPDIRAGAAVYAGRARRCRQDTEVVPLAAPGGMPERLDGRKDTSRAGGSTRSQNPPEDLVVRFRSPEFGMFVPGPSRE